AQELLTKTRVPPVVALEHTALDNALDYENEIARAGDAEPISPNIDGEAPYCILYTSGTTGKPKGAVIPHRQVLWNCINTVISWGLTESDVAPILTPLSHAGGLFVFLTPLLYVGGRIVLGRTFDPEASLKMIVDEGCTVILGVPTMFRMWQETAHFNDADF